MNKYNYFCYISATITERSVEPYPGHVSHN